MHRISPIGQSTAVGGVGALGGTGSALGGKGFANGMQGIASLLGDTPQQLWQSLAGGQSLAQVLQAAGKTPDQGAQAYLSGVQSGVESELASGKITQQQATNILTSQTSRIDALLGTSTANPGLPAVAPSTSTGSRLNATA